MSKPSEPHQPNLKQAAEFLSKLPHSMSETVADIRPGSLKFSTFEHSNLAPVIAWIAKAQGEANFYFHANPLKADVRNRKAKKEDVAAARLVHVDIDDLTALPRLKAFPLPPSVTVMSGGGYQALWFLKEACTDLAKVESLNKRVAAILGGDSCHSSDHLLRLPGTLNVPYGKKLSAGRTTVLAKVVDELTDYSRRYELDEFDGAVSALGRSAGSVVPAPTNEMPELIDAASLADTVPADTLALIRDGDDPSCPIKSKEARFRSRSEVVFAVCLELVRAKVPAATIVGVLLNPVNGISASILDKSNPLAYAYRQANRAELAVGEGWATVNKNGHPTPSYVNAQIALTRLGLSFEFDQFKNRSRVDGRDLQQMTGDLSDAICVLIRDEVLSRWGLDLGKEHVRDAAQALCMRNPVHPVKEYLGSLKWDGVPRLADWLTTYLGAEASALHEAISKIVLVAAVRRVRQPGAKFDTIVVLEGPQGSGKSTALLVLAGKGHFSDQDILTLDARAQMEAIEGIWIFELGELQGLGKADIDRVKAFASRLSDRARPAYGRYSEERLRQVIFVGTTNDEHYLRDPTGNRRFWPVRTGTIDLLSLARDRDQLWAEAAQLEAEGYSLTLPEHLWPIAAEAQEKRMLEESWQQIVSEFEGSVENEIERTTTYDVLHALGVPADRQNQGTTKRLARIMRDEGWTQKTIRDANGKVRRGYERPAPSVPDRTGRRREY